MTNKAYYFQSQYKDWTKAFEDYQNNEAWDGDEFIWITIEEEEEMMKNFQKKG